jgi:hypothetical protein
MKKLLIVVILVAVVAGLFKFMGKSADFEQLEYVPADTPILSAQLEPIDMQSYLSSLGIFPGQMDQFIEMLEAESDLQGEPTSVFFITLLESYIDALNKPEELTNLTGLKNELRSMLYMVGISPVLQVELGNTEQFVAFFQKAQEKSGISYSKETVDGNDYHRFVLDAEGEFELLVRVSNNWGVVTLHNPKFDKEHLLASLAISKPEDNIVNTGLLETMQDDYNLALSGIGFVSTKQFGLAFTTKDGNALARDLEFLGGEEFSQELSLARTPACKADVDMLTEMWPGLFMSSEIKTGNNGELSIMSRSVFPSTSKTAIDSLKALRGFLPSYTTDGSSSSFAKMGLGIEVANLSRSVNSMWSGLVNLELNCEPLQEMQQELKQNNPTGAFAMAGVANGLMGFGAAINTLDMTGMQEGNLGIDALVSVSAEDVKALYGTIQTFAPMLGAITLPEDGEELNVNELFPMLDQFGVSVTAMATQTQLVLFSGDIAREQASKTLDKAPNKNGLLSFGLDYKAFFEQLKPALEMSGEPIPPELEAMLETDMSITIKTDISDIGIEMSGEMLIKK